MSVEAGAYQNSAEHTEVYCKAFFCGARRNVCNTGLCLCAPVDRAPAQACGLRTAEAAQDAARATLHAACRPTRQGRGNVGRHLQRRRSNQTLRREASASDVFLLLSEIISYPLTVEIPRRSGPSADRISMQCAQQRGGAARSQRADRAAAHRAGAPAGPRLHAGR